MDITLMTRQEVKNDHASDYLYIGFQPRKEKVVNALTLQALLTCCQTYIDQLVRRLGEPPGSCAYVIVLMLTDGVKQVEVAVRFDADNETGTAYAFDANAGDPYWDDIASRRLRENTAFAAVCGRHP